MVLGKGFPMPPWGSQFCPQSPRKKPGTVLYVCNQPLGLWGQEDSWDLLARQPRPFVKQSPVRDPASKTKVDSVWEWKALSPARILTGRGGTFGNRA